MPQNWILNRTQSPSSEPVTRDELKNQARVLQTDLGQDATLDAAIASARDQLELRTDIAVMEQQWELRLRSLPSELDLPKPPYKSVVVSYVDADGVEQEFSPDNYDVIDGGYCPAKLCVYGAITMPTVDTLTAFPWRLAITCGQSDAGLTYPGIKGAILLLAAWLYEQRETCLTGTIVAEVPHAFDAICQQYAVYWNDPR